jgi:hypothetical protein
MDVHRPDAARTWAGYRRGACRANARIAAAALSPRGSMVRPYVRFQLKSACAVRIAVVPMPCTKAGQFLRCYVTSILRITAPSGIVETLYPNALTLLWRCLPCTLSIISPRKRVTFPRARTSAAYETALVVYHGSLPDLMSAHALERCRAGLVYRRGWTHRF